MHIQLPFNKEEIKKYKIGDVLYLSGTVYTARDAAHKRMAESINNGKEIPLDLTDQIIFYTGPCPAKPGHAIGSLSPTTSLRMDTFVETLLQNGMIAMIGKGDRSDYIPPLCKKYGALYLLAIGGAAALYSSQVTDFEVIGYEDLGTESIKRLTVSELKVIVGIDNDGNVLQPGEIAKYRTNV